MPLYQLPVAITLLLLAVASFLVLLFSQPKEGKIKLPEYHEDAYPDPFDVTTPEDVVDGEPIGGPEFWRRMRLTKLILSFDFTVIFALQAICLGWSASAIDSSSLAISILNLLFAFYVLVLTVRSMNQDVTSGHFESIVHLGVLLFFASILLGTISIVPSDKPIIASEQDSMPEGLWYTVFALYLIAFIITINVPRGPPLHFPPSQIYSEKTVSAVTNVYEDNVCGIVGASIWDTLLFSYTTKVVMLGNTAASLEIGDLPIVSADMRATFIFNTMKHAMRTVTLKVGNWKPKPGAGWEIAYRLLRVNCFLFALETMMAVVTAVLFYTPALFLRSLVAYLESDPDRTDRGWGFFFCVGLFLSNAIMQILTGQLWSIATTTLQVRLRIQLNSILYAKTLDRKDIASSSANASEDDFKEPTVVHGSSTTEESTLEPEKSDEGDFLVKLRS